MEFPIVPSLLVALLLPLCSMSNPPSVPPMAVGGDCGVFSADGQDCFEAAMNSCTPAKVLLFEGVPPVSAEIQSANVGGSTCSVSLKGIGKSENERDILG